MNAWFQQSGWNMPWPIFRFTSSLKINPHIPGVVFFERNKKKAKIFCRSRFIDKRKQPLVGLDDFLICKILVTNQSDLMVTLTASFILISILISYFTICHTLIPYDAADVWDDQRQSAVYASVLCLTWYTLCLLIFTSSLQVAHVTDYIVIERFLY